MASDEEWRLDAGCRVETERSVWTALIFKRTSSFISVRHPSGSVCNGYDGYGELIIWVWAADNSDIATVYKVRPMESRVWHQR